MRFSFRGGTLPFGHLRLSVIRVDIACPLSRPLPTKPDFSTSGRDLSACRLPASDFAEHRRDRLGGLGRQDKSDGVVPCRRGSVFVSRDGTLLLLRMPTNGK